MKGLAHMGAAVDVAPMMVSWLVERFAGNPAPSDCAELLKASEPPG